MATKDSKSTKEQQKEEEKNDKKKQRKTTLCCLTEDQAKGCSSKKLILLRFVALCFISLLVLCIVYGVKSGMRDKHGVNLEEFYTVGDPVYARDLWLVVELASDNRGRRTREGKESAAHVCSAIRAAQTVGWTPLIVGARSPCCRSSRCRHLHPTDLERLNYTLSAYFENQGETRMALKSAGFLAAIERGAHFIFQANPEVYYRANVSPKQYQSELERQLRKTTLGISVGMVKTFKDGTHDVRFDPYGHFGQAFQSNDFENNINQYKICEIKPPSVEKFLDSDGISLDVSAPAFTIPGGRASSFDTRNAAFAKDAFVSLFLLPNHDDLTEKDQYYIRSLFSNALLKLSAGSSKFSTSEVPTVGFSDITTKSELILTLENFFMNWKCTDYTVLACLQELGGNLHENKLISQENLQLMQMWVSDLISIGYKNTPVIPNEILPHEPCIGTDSLSGVYFHPSVGPKNNNELQQQQSSRQGKSINDEGFENKLEKAERFASRMIQRLCPAVDLEKALINYKQYDPHDGLLLIVTFYKKDYHNIPLLEIMYRHHFKNILYCGEPDPLVDEYMKHYNGESGTYFSFLPVHHMKSAGYECLLGAIELGYIVDGFLLVNEDTLINSWNFKSNDLDPKTIWHGNEHATTISSTNLNQFKSEPKDIMKSMLGILHAFQFLEQVLLSNNHPSFKDVDLEVPPLSTSKHVTKRSAQQAAERVERSADYDTSIDEDYSDEEMTMAHDDEILEDSKDADDHEMSIVDDNNSSNNRTEKEWHINLFGEIVHDQPEDHEMKIDQIDVLVQLPKNNVSELLFHPANFMNEDLDDLTDDKDMEKEHFSEMMFNIKSIYQRIHDKLNLWTRFKKLRMKLSHENEEEGKHEMKEMMEKLEDLNCNNAANAEICHLVASFFEVLDYNEGDHFKLVYDDLPIYYVPEALKERLYLMANLFTKYHVSDELAFPLLLRGLEKTENWTKLSRSDLTEREITEPKINKPEDLFSEALDDKIEHLDAIESAHYIYPVDVKSVLTNQDLKTVVCRNF